MTATYPILAIDGGGEIPEQLGTKEKFWIEHDGALCLLKFGRQGTGEDWAEKIACELCTLLDIPHAHYDLATCRGRSAVLSPSIVETDGRLILGNELVNRVSRDYDGALAYQQTEHTVSRVLAALSLFTRVAYRETWDQFLGYLLLDAWIGNTDRHHENWGLVVTKDRRVNLAPTFDHASSLGRELTDARRLRILDIKDRRQSITDYTAKARSALYAEASDGKPLSPIDAFALAARARRTAGHQWLDRLEAIDDAAVVDVVSRVPPELMSCIAKDFCLALLSANKAALVGLRKRI
jgi:hypothetical protein